MWTLLLWSILYQSILYSDHSLNCICVLCCDLSLNLILYHIQQTQCELLPVYYTLNSVRIALYISYCGLSLNCISCLILWPHSKLHLYVYSDLDWNCILCFIPWLESKLLLVLYCGIFNSTWTRLNHPDDGGSVFLQNVGKFNHYKVQRLKRKPATKLHLLSHTVPQSKFHLVSCCGFSPNCILYYQSWP